MALRHWLQLAMTDGIGPVLTRRIIEAAGSVESACTASTNLLRTVEGIGTQSAGKIASALREADTGVDSEIDKASRLGIRLICPEDQDYPILLSGISDPPNVLYVKGTIEPRDLQAVAIVGSRRCSFYGREQAERFAALLAGAGVVVISGGARGVDSAAHRGALSHPQGRTIAVLGSGVDVTYPSENEPLFRQIAERGVIISEYPLGTPPLAENFPRRNRIVSGMSRGVLVIEADIRSGALITARLAGEEQGRALFALPGRVDNAMSAGPHQLIRDGATLVTKLEDILDGLSPLPDTVREPTLFSEPSLLPVTRPDMDHENGAGPSASTETSEQTAILLAVSNDPVSVDTIIDQTGLPASVVMSELTRMTLRGMIKREGGQAYVRRK